MSGSIDARTIKDIINGGSVQAGHGVFFELLLQDGTTEKFHCDFTLMSRLLGNLRQYGAMADSLRSKVKAGEIDIAAPYVVDRVSNSANSREGKIVALEVVVKDGFPIQLAMTPDQARQSIAFLQRELDNLGQPPNLPRTH